LPDVIQRGKLVTLTYAIADKQGNVLEQNDCRCRSSMAATPS